jgi:hypothetical protein
MHRFWKQLLERYGSEAAYTKAIITSFGQRDGIEILIVVDKLLTGFDEPRNTVLYIDKPLKGNTLLQAIARVNRLADGKDYGYIIDYRGVLGELNAAMNLYDALAEYDAEDVADTLTDIRAEIARLPQVHSDLWAIFAGVRNQRDTEALEALRNGQRSGQPAQLLRYCHAGAYYGVIRDPLAHYGLSDEQIAAIAIAQEAIIEAHKITDWATNLDIQRPGGQWHRPNNAEQKALRWVKRDRAVRAKCCKYSRRFALHKG